MTVIQKGSTDVTRYVVLRDSADGTVETGFTITGLDLQYTRSGAAPSTKADATALAATDSAHGDNQAIEIDATSSPGLYRVDWPDAAFATGVDKVILVVSGTGLDPAVEEIQLVDYDPEDSVRLGLTALPNAAADAAGGLPISDAGGLDLDTQLAATNEVTAARMGALTDWINGGRLDLLLDAIKVVTDNLPDSGALNDLAAILTDTGTTLPATLSTIDTVVDAIKVVTDLLNRSVGVIQEFTIDNTSFTATTTAAQVDAVDIDSLEATDDHYIGRVIIFTSGALKHQATTITDYDGTNKRFTYETLTEAPANNDTFLVV